MKTFTLYRIPILIFIAFSSLIMSSCCGIINCITPKGPVLMEKRTINRPYDAIELKINAKVLLNYGTDKAITLHAAGNLLENITTTVAGGTLIIDQYHCMRVHGSDIIITLSQEHLSGLKILGGGSVHLNDYFENEIMEMEISGSGSITGEVFGNEIYQKISGSGKIDLSGEFYYQKILISGSGNVRNRHLRTKETDVQISGSGNAYVNASRKLNVKISGSGKVFYFGNPSIISTTISGSGNVIPM
jgi:hypothetical protein